MSTQSPSSEEQLSAEIDQLFFPLKNQYDLIQPRNNFAEPVSSDYLKKRLENSGIDGQELVVKEVEFWEKGADSNEALVFRFFHKDRGTSIMITDLGIDTVPIGMIGEFKSSPIINNLTFRYYHIDDEDNLVSFDGISSRKGSFVDTNLNMGQIIVLADVVFKTLQRNQLMDFYEERIYYARMIWRLIGFMIDNQVVISVQETQDDRARKIAVDRRVKLEAPKVKVAFDNAWDMFSEQARRNRMIIPPSFLHDLRAKIPSETQQFSFDIQREILNLAALVKQAHELPVTYSRRIPNDLLETIFYNESALEEQSSFEDKLQPYIVDPLTRRNVSHPIAVSISKLAGLLECYPKVFENCNLLLSEMTHGLAKVYVAVNTQGLISFTMTVLFSRDTSLSPLRTDTFVAPISKEMKEIPAMFLSPVLWSQFRSLIASLDCDRFWRACLEMDSRWTPIVFTLIQSELDNPSTDEAYDRHCNKLLRKLAKKNSCLPAPYLLEDIERVGQNAEFAGGFGDIWQGRLEHKTVCLKVLRLYQNDDRDNVFKHLYREILVWKQLSHKNILPFLGVSLKLFSPSFCMISPWMENGHIMSFLRKNPDHNRYQVISEIAEGIDYLHSIDPPVVHGDIKGSNVLVTEDHVCCLADFGLAVVSESHPFPTTSSRRGGTMRWLSPEILLPSEFTNCSPLARDIYAFGCTILEIITGQEPFSEPRLSDGAVMMAVIRGERPIRPANNQWCVDMLWALIEDCWDQEASHRPSAKNIIMRMLDVYRDYLTGCPRDTFT